MTSMVGRVSGFRELFEILQRNVRDAGKWWPAETKFEILVGSVLTQNTTWTSVGETGRTGDTHSTQRLHARESEIPEKFDRMVHKN